jgi:hypothetical protein
LALRRRVTDRPSALGAGGVGPVREVGRSADLETPREHPFVELARTLDVVREYLEMDNVVGHFGTLRSTGRQVSIAVCSKVRQSFSEFRLIVEPPITLGVKF